MTELVTQYLKKAPFTFLRERPRGNYEVFERRYGFSGSFLDDIGSRRIMSSRNVDVIDPEAARLSGKPALYQPPSGEGTYVVAVPRPKDRLHDQLEWARAFKRFGLQPAGPHELAWFSGFCNPNCIDARYSSLRHVLPVAGIAPAYMSNVSGKRAGQYMPYCFWVEELTIMPEYIGSLKNEVICTAPGKMHKSIIALRVGDELPPNCSFLVRLPE